jgi:hypothetical protein
VIHDLENAYESKLSLEMERYDRLSEEIEDVQQRCEGLLEAQRHEHEAAIRAAEGRTKKIEKELRLQIDRLHEVRACWAGGLAYFNVILDHANVHHVNVEDRIISLFSTALFYQHSRFVHVYVMMYM